MVANYKHIAVFALTVVLIASSVLIAQAQSEPAAKGDTYKFDSGFHEKVKQLQSASTTFGRSDAVKSQPANYTVILITNAQDDLVNDLKSEYGATNIFHSDNLSTVVTADVPINQIIPLSLHANVIKIGDGELNLISIVDYDPANATQSSIADAKYFHSLHSGIAQTGMGVNIGVIDMVALLDHDDLPAIRYVTCGSRMCQIATTGEGIQDTHANQVISIIAGSGNSNGEMEGMAANSHILYTSGGFASARIQALSHHLDAGTDVILIVSGLPVRCIKYAAPPTNADYPAIAYVVDEVVDRGVHVVTGVGNDGDGDLTGDFLLDVACAYNSIAVGNVDKDKDIWSSSSRGGNRASGDASFPMKPDISALGVAVAGASQGSSYVAETGTSFSSSMVASAVALLLEANDSLTPQQAKIALLLGAETREFATGTAKDYEERTNPVYNAINQYGLGVLNIQESLDAVAPENDRLVTGRFGYGTNTTSVKFDYRIYAALGDTVKLFLNYPYKPSVNSDDDVTSANSLLPAHPSLLISNFNINVTSPSGRVTQSNSTYQTTEFVIFEADITGYYDVDVQASSLVILYNDTRNFVPYSLGSSHRIEAAPFPDTTNHPPTISVTSSPSTPVSGNTVTFTAAVSDHNRGDTATVKWNVVREDIDISLDVSADGTGATFVVPYLEGTSHATFAARATATDQHQSSSNPATASVTADIVSPDTSNTILYEDFSTLSNWDKSSSSGWESVRFGGAVPPGGVDSNRVAESGGCRTGCTITTSSGIDLTNYAGETLQFYRYIEESLDTSDYLLVQAYDGSNWVDLDKWSGNSEYNDDMWHLEAYSLAQYTDAADFKLRFTARTSQTAEEVRIDDVRIVGTPTSDSRPPTITSPPNIVMEATGQLTSVDIGTVTADDDRDPNPSVTNDAPSLFPLGTTTVTWTATDSSGNFDTTTHDITVQDTTPPDIEAPPDTSFSTARTSVSLTEDDYGAATATDLVDSSPTITSNAPTSFDAGRTTTITWIAEDRYHNSATDTQLITVIRSSLNITAPPDVTVEATGSTMVIDIGTANATHDTDTDLTISNDAPESFPVGVTTTVTWKVVDSSSVTAMANQLVTVQDTTPPTFDEAPQDLSFVFDPDVPLIVNYDSPMATDIVDDSVGISCLPASGTAFGEGATTVTCTATDDYSNSADVTFDVSVRVYDTTVFSDGFEGRVHDSWDSPQFSFWSTDYNVPVTVPGHGSSNKIAHAAGCDFAGGCVMELTDGLDLSNHTDPEFLKFYRYLDTRLDPGDYLKLEAYDGSAWAELGRWNPENSEDDGAWHLEEYDLANYTDSSGFKLRFTAVAGSGIDEFGVDDVLVYKVPEVASNGTALAITAPADVVAEATGTLTAVDIGTATATGGFGNVTISHEPQAPFPLGNTTVTWTALDSNGTSATDTQLVTVQDTTAPTIASITRSNPAGGVTNSTSLIFAVTFSEDVTGVGVSDFALSPNSTGGGASATGQFAQTSEPALPIPDRSTIRDAITVGQSGNATSASVAVDVTHTYIGDLKIDIIAPDGTTRTLHDRTGYETDDIDQTYAPDFAGVSIAGDWTLRVRDGAGGDTGTLNGWTLTVNHGGAGSPVTGLTGSGSVYYATVSAAQDGTYNLDLVSSGHGIADAADSPLADPNPTGADHTYTVDTAAPTVASIERSNPAVETTSAQTLVFAVTFSEDVTGVDLSDFALSPGSTGGGSAPGQFTQTSEPATRIADRGTIQDAIAVDRSGTATSVSVAVDISHTYIGDLVVDLIAPDGTSQTLHSRTGGSANDIDRTYAPDFDGTGIAGDWTLRVSDRAGGDVGTLNGWTLTIGHGTAGSPVTGLAGSGNQYLVTVSAAQDGTYNLDLASSGHGIADTASNPLSSPTPTGADHTYTRTSP